MIINFKNIEELIFKNKNIREKFPEFKAYFQQWDFSKQYSTFKSLGKQAVLDLMNKLNDRHVAILEDFFNQKVTISKIDNWIVKEFVFQVDELEIQLNELKEISSQLSLYREGDQVYLTVWR